MSTPTAETTALTAGAQPAPGRTVFIVTLLAATFLMGSSFIAGKILLNDGFSPLVLVGWRCFLAALATAPLIYFDEGSFRDALLPPGAGLREFAIVALIGLLQTAGMMGFLFLAMQFISASAGAILLFTNPIWVAVLGLLFLGETLHGSRIIGLVLGLIGVVCALGVGLEAFSSNGGFAGEAFGLASAFCWTAATIINKRAKLPFGGWAMNFWQMLIGSLVLLIIAYAAGERWPQHVTLEQWGWFLWLAIPASTGSFGLWFVALRQGGATRTSGYLFLAPLFAVILSFLIMGSTLTWIQALGGAFICLALWLINREGPARRSGNGGD